MPIPGLTPENFPIARLEDAGYDGYRLILLHHPSGFLSSGISLKRISRVRRNQVEHQAARQAGDRASDAAIGTGGIGP